MNTETINSIKMLMSLNCRYGKTTTYRNLPKEFKEAVRQYLWVEYDMRGFSNKSYMHAKMKLSTLIDIVRGLNKDYANFEDYHKKYINGLNFKTYSDDWAILLTFDEDDFILDGWHRFHSYIERGCEYVNIILLG